MIPTWFFRNFEQTADPMMKKILLIVCALSIYTGTHGQVNLTPSVLSSAGGYGFADNFSISWTLGEFATTTLIGENMIFTQGFQQTFSLDVGIPGDEPNWSVSVYPNPVGRWIQIDCPIPIQSVELWDTHGRLLFISQVAEGQYRFSLPSFPPGVLILKAHTENGIITRKMLCLDR